MNSFLFILLFVSLSILNAEAENCTDFKTCGRCIGNKLKCVWCTDKNHKGTRCQPRTFKDGNKEWCKEFQDPFATFNSAVKNDEFSSSANKPVQLRPQKVLFKARPGESTMFYMSYKPAKNYPLDVYFLMDNSYTMGFHMTTLFKEAKMIYESLTKLTNNVRFGAGSFIEKCAFPFANPNRSKPSYSFKNHLPMNDDIDNFVSTIKQISDTFSAGNHDIQEATLDALMQAMVCTQEINWRDSWKLIVISTDAPYHSAGDGKLVGAYKPNDMQCHLTDGTYDKNQSLLYDYPSVSQINKVAKEKEIAILFAVLKKVKKTYEMLGKRIDNARIVELKGTATEKSEIVETITIQYKNLTQELTMTRMSVPSFINVELNPPCRDKTDGCKIKHEEPFQITVTLTMNSCPDDNFTRKMEIGPAMLEDKVEVDVEVLCNCDCEKYGEVNSIQCHGNGTYQCGVCDCNTNSYGEKCQCIGSSSEELDNEKCKPNKGDTQVCSGRGVCKCGKCQDCPDDYMGEYCETAKYDCPAPHDKVCGGHGMCLANNTCDCHTGWIGSACTCTTSKDTCTGPYNTVCNEHGTCTCGICVCTEMDSKGNNYTGQFCNICEEGCNRCVELADYAECNYDQNKDFCDQKTVQLLNHEVIKLNQTEIKAHVYRKAKPCSKVLQDGSTIFFKYIDKQNSTLILIQKEKEPAPVAQIWIPVTVAVAIMLFIGIVTLVAWKILVDLHDKRESRKFAEAAASNGFDVAENPIYRPPAVNINNPAYCGRT